MDQVDRRFSYTFYGELLGKGDFIDNVEKVLIIDQEGSGIRGSLEIVLSGQRIGATFRGVREVSNFDSLVNLVRDAIQGILDVFSYLMGASINFHLLVVGHPGGALTLLGNGIRELANRYSNALGESDRILKVLGRQSTHVLWRAIADFRQAIAYPADTPFYCYRAVESLRYYFDTENKKRGWEKLRVSLGIEKKTIDSITKHADDIRHGKSIFVSEGDRLTYLKIADQVIQKFVDYIEKSDPATPAE